MWFRHGDKKEKKKAQNKKNRFQQELFQWLRLKRAEEQRVKDIEKAQHPKAVERAPDEVNDKVAVIRNRLTGQKRVSRERWNRFAGTSGGGGRGL